MLQKFITGFLNDMTHLCKTGDIDNVCNLYLMMNFTQEIENNFFICSLV